MADIKDYMEGNYDGEEMGEQIAQVLQDVTEAAKIAKEVENLYVEYETREDTARYLVDGAFLRCSQATLQPFKMSDGTQIPVNFSEKEMDDKHGRHRRRERLYNELHVTDGKMTNGTLLHATVLDCEQGKNVYPFQCNCKLADDRKEEYEKIKANLEDCKKNGVCQYLMRLSDKWENMPRNNGGFYCTRQIKVPTETQSGEIKESTVHVPCITMTSMLFCRHGGLITPVYSGQEQAETLVIPQYSRITRVSDKLIRFLKDYEGEAGTGGAPVLSTYQLESDKPGIHTIGWEHAMESESEGNFKFSEGDPVNLYSLGTKIDEWQAEELLAYDIRKVEDAINFKLVDGGIEYKVNQRFYDALADLLFQSGTNQIEVGKNGKITDLYNFLTEEKFDLNNMLEISLQFGEYNGFGSKEVKREGRTNWILFLKVTIRGTTVKILTVTGIYGEC